MERFSKSTRGAVSVFLLMILVPCIAFSSVFVDLSRVHLSKASATSTADLALNSLLTNYDADLKEWYGMAASCQTIDQFYEASAQLFVRMMASQGLSDEELYTMFDSAINLANNNAFREEEISDLLKVECLTAPSEMITAVENANLTNPSLVKDQVVEFMKYRAPIELTLGILDRLKKDPGVQQTKTIEQDEKIVNAKTTHYEAEGDFLSAAFKYYCAVMDYNRYVTNAGLSNASLNQDVAVLVTYYNVYKAIHALYVKQYYGTGGVHTAGKYSRVTKSIPAASDVNSVLTTETTEHVQTDKNGKTTTETVETTFVSLTTTSDALTDLESAISSFEGKITAFETAAGEMVTGYGTGDEDANAIQWWVQMYNKVGGTCTSDIETAAGTLSDAYAKVLAIESALNGGYVVNGPVGWAETKKSLVEQAKSLFNTYLSATSTANNTYITVVKNLETVSSDNAAAVNPANGTVTLNGSQVTVESALSTMSKKLSDILTAMDAHIKEVDVLINGNEEKSIPSASSLTTLASNYDTTLSAWNDATTSAQQTSPIKTESESEIAGKTTKLDTSQVSEATVTAMSTRLNNIKTQFEAVKTQVGNLKYGSTAVKDISAYDTFKTAAGTLTIPLTNKALNDYVNSSFAALISPDSTDTIKLENGSNNDYDPRINPESDQVNVPDLVEYLHKCFEGLEDKKPEVEAAEEDEAKVEGEAENQEKAAKDKDRYTGNGVEIKPEFSPADATFDILADSFSAISGLISTLTTDGFLQTATDIRDDIYVTSYIMNMFSYATYENEGKYRLLPDGKKTELTLSEYPKIYGEYADKWASEKLSDTYNKSLTNKMITSGNNAAYAAEVEYILYGGRTSEPSTNADNVKSVYANIFGIRYALNLVSAFANFWSRGNTTSNLINTVAESIAALTAGIVPAPVTKCVLILILPIPETVTDMNRLEAGFPVELYKSTHEAWWVAIPSGKTLAKDEEKISKIWEFVKNGPSGRPNADQGIFYSDYLTLFVYLGLQGENASAMYQRLAEVIQANIRHVSGEKTYSMANARMYFTLNTKVRVKPLMFTLPIYNDYENDLQTKTDWCTYSIKLTRGYS